MDLKAGLFQQQALKLTMTQELTQSIAILQYSAHELASFLENKALENPLLQIETAQVQPINPLLDRQKKKRPQEEKEWFEQIAETPFSLEEMLLSQLNIKKLSNSLLKSIRCLVQYIDENGYLKGSVDEIASALHMPIEVVEDGLAIIQTLEPAGIGARNLQECLLLQLPDHDLARRILEDYFLLFADKKWKQIAKELNVSLKDIQEASDLIQLLNPRPGAVLGNEKPSYILPDVIVEKSSNGYIVRMFDDTLPKITFNNHYYNRLTAAKDPQVSKFLQEKFQDYQWTMRSIEQRKETLTKVVLKIIEKQPLFFQKGPLALLPMTMKDIANDLEIHESTVSRAVREKYVQTPLGTFTLKSFFTSLIQTVDHDSTSSARVKNAISMLIEKEDKQKPLSDQEIVELLKHHESMVVSRRTIAKYRDQMGIPSSTKRKRY